MIMLLMMMVAMQYKCAIIGDIVELANQGNKSQPRTRNQLSLPLPSTLTSRHYDHYHDHFERGYHFTFERGHHFT